MPALSSAPAFLGAEHDVFKDAEVVDQHEVLVNHADAHSDGGVRVLDHGRLAVNEDVAIVGLIEAVEDDINVDLPAPFSPMIPWIVPFRTSC
jgi:hypothetical protein